MVSIRVPPGLRFVFISCQLMGEQADKWVRTVSLILLTSIVNISARRKQFGFVFYRICKQWCASGR